LGIFYQYISRERRIFEQAVNIFIFSDSLPQQKVYKFHILPPLPGLAILEEIGYNRTTDHT
jgi:hypothetical protein